MGVDGGATFILLKRSDLATSSADRVTGRETALAHPE